MSSFNTNSISEERRRLVNDKDLSIDIEHDSGIKLNYDRIIKDQKNLCPPEPFIPSQTYNPKDFLKRQENLLMNVTDLTVVTGAGQIIASSEPKEGIGTIMDSRTCDDLGLTSGKQGSKKCVCAEINRTKTVAGRLFLFGRVARPTDNMRRIKNRQEVTRTLTTPKYQNLLADLQRELVLLGKNEPDMLGFENSKLALPGRVDKLFWKYGIQRLDEIANSNSYAITFNATVETSKALIANGLQTAATVALPLYAISLTGVLPETATAFLSSYASRFAASSGPLYAIGSIFPSSIVRGGMGVLGGTIASLSLTTQWEWFATDLKMESMLHTKMLSVARYFRSIKAVYKMLLPHEIITSKLEHFHKLKSFFENKDLKTLFDAFESRTFNSESNLFFQRGNVLFPWRRLENPKVREEFRKAIIAIAEIDCIVSTVELVKEHHEGRVQFCFPVFLEGRQLPEISLTDYWNPIIPKEKVVVNSINLGERHHAPNIVITGPNAGGKSTSLRAILSAVVFAHSLGIGPATGMALTPFSLITSSMQTTDNAQTGQSLFQAQTQCITDLHNAAKTAPDGVFAITALDEIFTGTRGKEGEPLAKASAQELGQYKNGIIMFATHFETVTDLERSGRYVNYKVIADIQNGCIVSPYTLTRGISTQYLGFEMAQQQGLDPAIIQSARAKKEAQEEKKFLTNMVIDIDS